MDLESMTTEELEALASEITVILQHRRILVEAPARAEAVKNRLEREQEAISASFLHARDGNEEACPWIQPTGAHDAYPKNWKVSHSSKVWKSLIAGNSHEPGTDHGHAWVEVVSTPPPGQYTAWGPGQVVVIDDHRTHDGRLWKAKVNHTTHEGWIPSVFTYAVWEDLGPITTTGR